MFFRLLLFIVTIPFTLSFDLTQEPNGDVSLFKKLKNANSADKFIVNGNELVTGFLESNDSDDKRALRILAMSLGYDYTALANGVSACKNNDASTCLKLCSSGVNAASCYCGESATGCSAGQTCTISSSSCS
jgi:hypothetical protein